EIFWRARARLVSTSPNSRQRTSMPRAASRTRRMSDICLSWKSLGADWVITSSSRSNVASTPLKSNRLASSRLAWSTALTSSWGSTSDATSKEGMAMVREGDQRGRLADPLARKPGRGRLERFAQHQPDDRQQQEHRNLVEHPEFSG